MSLNGLPIPTLESLRKLDLQSLSDVAWEASQEAARIYAQGEWEADFDRWQRATVVQAMAETVMSEVAA